MSVLDPGSDPWLAQIEEEISHLMEQSSTPIITSGRSASIATTCYLNYGQTRAQVTIL